MGRMPEGFLTGAPPSGTGSRLGTDVLPALVALGQDHDTYSPSVLSVCVIATSVALS